MQINKTEGVKASINNDLVVSSNNYFSAERKVNTCACTILKAFVYSTLTAAAFVTTLILVKMEKYPAALTILGMAAIALYYLNKSACFTKTVKTINDSSGVDDTYNDAEIKLKKEARLNAAKDLETDINSQFTSLKDNKKEAGLSKLVNTIMLTVAQKIVKKGLVKEREILAINKEIKQLKDRFDNTPLSSSSPKNSPGGYSKVREVMVNDFRKDCIDKVEQILVLVGKEKTLSLS